MTRAGRAATLIWAALLGIAAVIVARAHYTTDLSAFLPRTPTAAQRLLVEQLREGIASRLILVGIEGADQAARARLSREMARRLRSGGQFISVNNGEPVGLDRDRALLFDHRYLLSDAVTPEHFTPSGLRAAIQESLDLLASPAGLLVKSLLVRDPTGEMLQIINQVGNERQPPLVDGAWASRDGKRALLVAQTRAAGSDTDGQQHAVETIREAFALAGGPPKARLEMSGPGVFSVAARSTIKHEVVRLSILSTGLIMLMLLVVYRSFLALMLGFVPVASGALAGVAAVALGFGLVHGITLGFGVTLIGESIDYSIYLFIQSQRGAGGAQSQQGAGDAHSQPGAGDTQSQQGARGAQWTRSLWPTIRLGVLTSIAGFASLLPSGFPGLAQLGLYSISGLVAAALVTRFVLPNWIPARLHIRDTKPLGVAVAAALKRVRAPRSLLAVVPILAAIVLYTHRDIVWNRELSALSPVSAADQALDGLLRTDIGAPDVRYLVVVSGADQESVLRAAEKVNKRLDALVDAGVIGGFESPAHYLPSVAAQRTRQASLPEEAQLRSDLKTALNGMPLRPERLEPFVHDVEAARSQPLVTQADLEGTSLATGVDALLLRHEGRWSALLPLRAAGSVAIDVARVHSAISQVAPGEAVVLDVKAEADRLYSSYLSEVVRLSLAGFAAIVVLLLLALRSVMRTLRVVAPLALAVLAVAGALVLSGRQLTILHLIGMLLIVAVGSNYALFFDRRTNDRHADEVPLTLASLVIANAATVLGFGLLATSPVPVLSALGSTVAPGAFLALIFSALLARDLPAVVRPVPG